MPNRKLPSELLKDKLEKIEISDTPENEKKFDQKAFERDAKEVKNTFEDEELPSTPVYI